MIFMLILASTGLLLLAQVLATVHRLRPESFRFRASITKWISLELEMNMPARLSQFQPARALIIKSHESAARKCSTAPCPKVRKLRVHGRAGAGRLGHWLSRALGNRRGGESGLRPRPDRRALGEFDASPAGQAGVALSGERPDQDAVAGRDEDIVGPEGGGRCAQGGGRPGPDVAERLPASALAGRPLAVIALEILERGLDFRVGGPARVPVRQPFPQVELYVNAQAQAMTDEARGLQGPRHR
jgi:hypothetical protein